MNNQSIGRTEKSCLAYRAYQHLVNNFCETPHLIAEQKANESILVPLSKPNFSYAFFPSIHQTPFIWDVIAPSADIFLQRPYLTALEDNPPAGMGFGYLIFYQEKQAVGIAVFQTVLFNVGNNIRTTEGREEENLVDKLKGNLKSAVSRQLEFRLLISGSLLLTGEHGHHFDPDVLSPETGVGLLSEALEKLREGLYPMQEPITTVLIKDVYADNDPISRGWRKKGFNEIPFQPNMVLRLRPEWHSFDDYLAAIQSKYRVRARRAAKKAAPMQRRELNLEEITAASDRLHELYLEIAQGAEFNAVFLHSRYLVGLKEELGDKFRLWGYFYKNEMVGFCTAIHNGKALEAHFLGTEAWANTEFQLYLKMLYDLLEVGIADPEAAAIIYARTAMEIKSSVGAEAHEMYCYLRHRNSLTNRLLPFFVNYLEPKVAWQARHPFK